ncbi:Acetyltransferase (GNAT) family protein [Pirellula sp. SH-Sr6A]|uniref:GNAT family N-acetyltransferase n=1 Tax=Pirellula sp. SH-Sr6A TaxID=1632865 RepID=UPI00078B1DBA|nr:GNAT family N-acetyltransferase [Pirellula sp. SH-Sr6A]AMV33434.1 Acetyltransferase (GNAT) family protein [Pirellula sp. SH-Sr6A]
MRLDSLTLRTIPGTECPAELWDLRFAVLREPLGGNPASARFVGDDLATTQHFTAWHEDRMVGCASLMLSTTLIPPDLPPHSGVWYQLRGMAVSDAVQGSGVGRTLLQAIDAWSAPNPAIRLWCNAREEAIDFYRKNGWQEIGEIFSIPNVGPHLRMVRKKST